MIIEQIVTVPADYRISLELPHSVPIGIKARVEISIPSRSSLPFGEIEEIRLLLQREMAEKGTTMVAAASGDGWEAHAREHYAEP